MKGFRCSALCYCAYVLLCNHSVSLYYYQYITCYFIMNGIILYYVILFLQDLPSLCLAESITSLSNQRSKWEVSSAPRVS